MTTVIVPCRMDSRRFPGKALAMVEGKPLFMHAVHTGMDAGFETIVATPDIEIRDECQKRDVSCVMTSKECPTGSHRVYEAAKKLNLQGPIINLQGDVVRFPPSYVQAVARGVGYHSPVATMSAQKVVLGSSHVRVITHNGRALSFSRSGGGWKHLGIYWYSMYALEQCFSEYRECDLEQDCIMDKYLPDVIEVPWDESYSVDHPEDIRA